LPALTPLIRLPQEIEGVMKIVEIDLGKSVNPVVGGGEAKQHGYKAAFSQNKCLSVLSASNVTPGFLDATNEEFEIIIRVYFDL
jgi:hypothetical protein